MSKHSYLKQFRDGILYNNPTFVQLLGMCPTLAVTTSVSNALGMGVAVIAVLAFSNLFISLVRKFIPNQVRIASYIVIISGFVTAVEMIIKAYAPELDKSLGLFIPLIVVNCIILARAEAFASKNKPLPSFVDGIAMGLGFTIAISIIAAIREIIGAGTFLGYPLFGESFKPAIMFIMPSGAFITLGVVVAAFQKLLTILEKNQKEKMKKEKEKASSTVEKIETAEEPEIITEEPASSEETADVSVSEGKEEMA